jgi:hypothetical protein
MNGLNFRCQVHCLATGRAAGGPASCATRLENRTLKNQYFGDINDYRKYGLLRILTNYGEIKTAVCWMLTPDDGRGDGGRVGYLLQPAKWRDLDPPLFDHLAEVVLRRGSRNVAEIGNSGILPSCVFLSDTVPDDEKSREAYFQRLTDMTQGCDLVFFDPDNGIEVETKQVGRKGSSKYIYWHEIEQFWNARHSLLIYQHFPRVQRDFFIEAKARQLMERTGAPEVISFRTSHVVFLLAPQAERTGFFRKRIGEVERAWGQEIKVGHHYR